MHWDIQGLNGMSEKWGWKIALLVASSIEFERKEQKKEEEK